MEGLAARHPGHGVVFHDLAVRDLGVNVLYQHCSFR